MIKSKHYKIGIAALLLIAGSAASAHAFAQSATPSTQPQGFGGMHMRRHAPGVRGTVTTISGDIITITSNGFGSNATTSTYTIDATNASVTKSGAASSISAIAVGDTIMVQGSVNGTNVTATKINDGIMQGGRGVFGTVASISGDTLTVTSKGFGSNAPATTYTVDASNATVTKSGGTSSVSAIAVGDNVMIQGTVSGTSVTATKINDGVAPRPMGGNSSALPVSFTGNGSPIVGGTVNAISGNTITFTNRSNVSYTADATSAVITKSGVTSPTISNISVGDSILVQGTVDGNTITATTVLDQGIAPSATQASTSDAPQQHVESFGGISGFFSKLFGF